MNIVLIHFGRSLPKYLRLNLDRIASTFPLAKTFLISDRSHADLPSEIEEFIVPSDPITEMLESRLSHPKFFRNNFWFLTLRRFLVFSDFMMKNPGSVLHIESDVVLSDDFPIKQFESIKTDFAFPIISEAQGIPSLLFLKDAAAANFLRNLTVSMSMTNPEITDMLVLKFLHSNNPEKVLVLPSGPSDKNYYKPDISEYFVTSQSDGISIFRGYFDGATVGQYLFGDDPRNNRGRRYLYLDSQYSSLLPSRLTIDFNSNRNFVDFRVNDSVLPLFNLHIHSKDVRAFSGINFSKLLRFRVLQSEHGPKTEFLTKVFVLQALKSIRRRLIAFFKGIKNA